MNLIKPVVGQWYRDVSDELFEIVAIDAADESIEVQYFDGSIAEMDFDSWNDQLRDGALELADAPEDWSGSVDIDRLDLDRAAEDVVRPQWSGHSASKP
jgi:hypothetical protein